MPALTGASTAQPHESLFWRFSQQRAIRHGDWKLVRGPQSQAWELYNLADDIGETTDLAACLLYTSPSPRDRTRYRMPSSA